MRSQWSHTTFMPGSLEVAYWIARSRTWLISRKSQFRSVTCKVDEAKISRWLAQMLAWAPSRTSSVKALVQATVRFASNDSMLLDKARIRGILGRLPSSRLLWIMTRLTGASWIVRPSLEASQQLCLRIEHLEPTLIAHQCCSRLDIHREITTALATIIVAWCSRYKSVRKGPQMY